MNAFEVRPQLAKRLLWGRQHPQPLSVFRSRWFAVGAFTCLMSGLPLLVLLPFLSWNGLVKFRNQLRCPTEMNTHAIA